MDKHTRDLADPFPEASAPDCLFCEEPIDAEKPVEVRGIYDHLDGYAHDGCLSDAGERAALRHIEDYYGSSTPQTDHERYRIAAEQKRRMR